jgi:hypothetical protein
MKFTNQQGDVVLFAVEQLPAGLKKLDPKDRIVLAEGELTGHAHAIHDLDNAQVYVAEDGTLFLDVRNAVVLQHEEHKPHTIQPGKYKVGRVREIDPFSEETRAVRD